MILSNNDLMNIKTIIFQSDINLQSDLMNIKTIIFQSDITRLVLTATASPSNAKLNCCGVDGYIRMELRFQNGVEETL